MKDVCISTNEKKRQLRYRFLSLRGSLECTMKPLTCFIEGCDIDCTRFLSLNSATVFFRSADGVNAVFGWSGVAYLSKRREHKDSKVKKRKTYCIMILHFFKCFCRPDCASSEINKNSLIITTVIN